MSCGGDVLQQVVHVLQITNAGKTQILTVAAEPQVLIDQAKQGVRGPPGPEGPAGGTSLTFPAGAALGGHRAVRLLNGAAIYASNDAPDDRNLVVGITRGAAVEGDDVVIQSVGLMAEPSWSWTPDRQVFLGLNGLLTQTPPTSGFILIIGIAVASDQILIGAKMPIIVI